jgi:hypothetical protein
MSFRWPDRCICPRNQRINARSKSDRAGRQRPLVAMLRSRRGGPALRAFISAARQATAGDAFTGEMPFVGGRGSRCRVVTNPRRVASHVGGFPSGIWRRCAARTGSRSSMRRSDSPGVAFGRPLHFTSVACVFFASHGRMPGQSARCTAHTRVLWASAGGGGRRLSRRPDGTDAGACTTRLGCDAERSWQCTPRARGARDPRKTP